MSNLQLQEILNNPSLINNLDQNEQDHEKLASEFCQYVFVDNVLKENFSLEQRKTLTELVEKLNLSSKFFIMDFVSSFDENKIMQVGIWLNQSVFLNKHPLRGEVKVKWSEKKSQERQENQNS